MGLAGIELRYLVDKFQTKFKTTILAIFMELQKIVFYSNFIILKKVIFS
jgi:hypothetical protein